jgi:hypothetical protein
MLPAPGATPALAGPTFSPSSVTFDPYGFGSEFWRWSCAALASGDDDDSACPAVGDVPASVMPGTEIKYTDPVGSVPPCA